MAKLVDYIWIVSLVLCSVWIMCAGGGNARGRNRPRQVSVQVLNTTTIEISWTPPKQELEDCGIERYMIRMKVEGAKRSRTWKIDGARTSLILGDLVAGNMYYIRLVAVMCNGKSPPSRWVTIRTTDPDNMEEQADSGLLENKVPGKPTYVRTRTFPDSVIVSWKAPEETDILIRGYICGYGEGVPDVNWKYVDASLRNVTIHKLKPSTQYVVSLRAYNNHGKGPVVYDLIYTREENEGPTPGPFASPTSLSAKVLSPSTAWLQWTDPSLGKPQHITDNRYYNVHYQALPNGKTLSVIVKALRVVLYDLVPGTKYEFKVRTVLDANASPFSRSVFNRTFETAPGSGPRSISVEGVDESNDVTVSWRPPRQPNGEITGYIVLYTVNQDLADREWQVKALPGSSSEVVLGPLAPNVTYYFKMQARNSVGFGPMSEVVSHYTAMASKAVTSSPRGLMVLPSDYFTEVVLSWTKPKHINSQINGYIVYFTWNVDLDVSDWVVHRVRGTATETTISGLRPNITYYFRVVPETNRGPGQPSSTVQYFTTDVDKPSPDPNIDENDYYDDLDDEDDDDAITIVNGTASASGLEDTDALNPQQAMFMSNQNISAPERKSKREHGVISHFDAKGWDSPEVNFKVTVVHHVTAYVTWPEKLSPCDCSTKVIGYVLRYYKREDGDTSYEQDSETAFYDRDVDYKLINVPVNFVVLEGLDPDSVYGYQVKYVLVSGPDSDWSQEAALDTHYVPPT